MSIGVFWGLVAGLSTMALSELILRLWGPSFKLERYWQLWFVGVAVRTSWVLGLLVLVLHSQWLEPKSFTLALLVGYLMAQVVEGFRYRHFVRKL